MNDCAFCLGYGFNPSHRDSSVKVTFFYNLAVEDIAKVLNGDMDKNLPDEEMRSLLKTRLGILEGYADQYVVLSKDGSFLGSGKSYNQLFTGGMIRDTEVRVYYVPPKDR